VRAPPSGDRSHCEPAGERRVPHTVLSVTRRLTVNGTCRPDGFGRLLGRSSSLPGHAVVRFAESVTTANPVGEGGQALARATPSRGPMLVRRRTADLSPVGRNRSFHVIFISPKGRCKNGRRVAVDGVPSPSVRS